VRTTTLGRGGPVVSRAGLELGPGDLAAVEAAVPAGAVAGERYDQRQMAALDSER
jgi:hypothetical protein